MPRPFGSRELRRLGEAMARHGVPLPDEYGSQYDDFLNHYDQVRAEVTNTVNAMPVGTSTFGQDFQWLAVGRTKSRETLLDKLRNGSNLATIRDVAGVRIVANCTTSQQDEIAELLIRRFESTRPPIDRRSDPRSGYRAVHLEVKFDDTPVEIQIRTRLQHIWAEIYEGLGDKWGRQIRYGGEPDDLDPESRRYKIRLIRLLESISLGNIANLERMIDSHSRAEPPNRAARRRLSKDSRALRKLEKNTEEMLHEWATGFEVAQPKHVPSEGEVELR